MSHSGDRRAARVHASYLLELCEVAPCTDQVDELLALGERRDWPEIVFYAHYCRLTAAAFSDEDVTDHLTALDAAAERSGDDALIAMALASRATHVLAAAGGPTGSMDERVEANLARAVATLEAGAGSAVDRPMAYNECGLAYKQRGLWELVNQMYERAWAALQVPLPADLAPIAVRTRSAVIVNRTQIAAIQACALLEIGDRERAKKIATERPRPTEEALAGLPEIWMAEFHAVDELLAAAAGEPATPRRDELELELKQSLWPGYRACLLLADAVRAFDTGTIDEAAELCERALPMLGDYDQLPTLRTLALNGAALVGPDSSPALRYARELALLRWESRLAVLGSARARLEAARVIREGERLARHAYLDELTGLANRHALARHRDRLAESSGVVAALVADVDHFKAVNDTFGHVVGDEVLRRIGAVLIDSARPVDLAVRTGGDEFLILMDSPGVHEVRGRAESLVAAVSELVWDDLASGLTVSVSVGLAVGAASDVDRVLHVADHNLYLAKAGGRGRTAQG
jgi:diguanylate cyclase (GGDEF)-like protein